MSKHKSKLAVFLSAILLFGTILPTLGNQKAFAAELTDIDYDPYIGDSVKVAPSFELNPDSGETFAEGYIKFEITDSNGYVPTDKLFLPDGEKVTLSDGSTLEVKGKQILLNGIAIASVNSAENGEGKALKIDLSAPLPNGNFEEGPSGNNVEVPSWTINHQSELPDGTTVNQIWLGDLAKHTQDRPYEKVESNGAGKYEVTGPNGEYTYTTNVNYNARANQSNSKDLQSVEGIEKLFTKWDTKKTYGFVQKIDTDLTKGQSLEIGFLNALLNTGDYNQPDGKIASSFGIEAVSSSFKAKKGDQLSFDWKANDGGDDYEVYGFLVNTETNETTEILYGRGSAQDWTLNSGFVPADGTYKFRFVAGSFNRTDGTTHGATLSIDNVRVVSTKVVEGVVNAIAQLVQYENSQYSGNRPVKISVVNSEGQESNITDNKVTIKMSTKDEAATSLDKALFIDTPPNGSYIYDPVSKTITGKSEPNSTVDVNIKGSTDYPPFTGTTITDKDGKWSIDLDDKLIKGDYTIEATTSKGGAISEPISSTFTFVDKTKLEQYYNQVKELKKDDYSSGWKEFDSALQAAKEILDNIADSSDNSNPTQAEIDQTLTGLQSAKENLEKLPPVAINPASFEDGNKEITIDFNKNIKLTASDTSEGFTVTVYGKEYKVTGAKSNGDKLTLTVDQPLDSDAKKVTVEYHSDTTSNLFGDEENGAAVKDFVIQAEDTFGHALQINEPNGTTYNRTPIIKGSADIDTKSAVITITGSNGSKVIVDKDNIKINPDGSWTYNVAEQLTPGEYEVKVTASKSGRPEITKYHKFMVAYPPVVNPIPPFGQDLQINVPNDITNDTTPSIKGTTDIGTERATITITTSNGSKVIVDKDNIKINSDGSWTYNVNQKLSPGEYEVRVTVSKTGYQDVMKSHKFIVVDKENLLNLRDGITGQKLINSEYTKDSWTKFEDAYTKAKTVLGNPKATQIEVDNATTTLKNAYKELVYKKGLEDEVKESNKLVQGNYTKDSWDAYQLQLIKAKKVLSNLAATKKQVNKEKADLEKARKALTPIVDNTKVDKTQLIKEYALSSKLKEKDYSTSSWAAYQKALKKANEVINDLNTTQFQVDSVKAMLEKARKALSVDKKPLDKEKELSEDLAANNYTKKSWKVYQDSLKHAKSILADRNATQYEINAALNSLKESKDALKRLKAESNVLPNTSTNTYNWLLLGLVFILLGAIFFLSQRNKMEKKS
ncbi:MAG: Ig-like domain-containing protein [Heyndrickxia sp.]